MSKSAMRADYRQKLFQQMADCGIFNQMQSVFMNNVTQELAKSDISELKTYIEAPKDKANDLAAQIIVQFLERNDLENTEQAAESESGGFLQRRQADNYISKELGLQGTRNLLADLVKAHEDDFNEPSTMVSDAVSTIVSQIYDSMDESIQTSISEDDFEEERDRDAKDREIEPVQQEPSYSYPFEEEDYDLEEEISEHGELVDGGETFKSYLGRHKGENSSSSYSEEEESDKEHDSQNPPLVSYHFVSSHASNPSTPDEQGENSPISQKQNLPTGITIQSESVSSGPVHNSIPLSKEINSDSSNFTSIIGTHTTTNDTPKSNQDFTPYTYETITVDTTPYTYETITVDAESYSEADSRVPNRLNSKSFTTEHNYSTMPDLSNYKQVASSEIEDNLLNGNLTGTESSMSETGSRTTSTSNDSYPSTGKNAISRDPDFNGTQQGIPQRRHLDPPRSIDGIKNPSKHSKTKSQTKSGTTKRPSSIHAGESLIDNSINQSSNFSPSSTEDSESSTDSPSKSQSTYSKSREEGFSVPSSGHKWSSPSNEHKVKPLKLAHPKMMSSLSMESPSNSQESSNNSTNNNNTNSNYEEEEDDSLSSIVNNQQYKQIKNKNNSKRLPIIKSMHSKDLSSLDESTNTDEADNTKSRSRSQPRAGKDETNKDYSEDYSADENNKPHRSKSAPNKKNKRRSSKVNYGKTASIDDEDFSPSGTSKDYYSDYDENENENESDSLKKVAFNRNELADKKQNKIMTKRDSIRNQKNNDNDPTLDDDFSPSADSSEYSVDNATKTTSTTTPRFTRHGNTESSLESQSSDFGYISEPGQSSSRKHKKSTASNVSNDDEEEGNLLLKSINKKNNSLNRKNVKSSDFESVDAYSESHSTDDNNESRSNEFKPPQRKQKSSRLPIINNAAMMSEDISSLPTTSTSSSNTNSNTTSSTNDDKANQRRVFKANNSNTNDESSMTYETVTVDEYTYETVSDDRFTPPPKKSTPKALPDQQMLSSDLVSTLTTDSELMSTESLGNENIEALPSRYRTSPSQTRTTYTNTQTFPTNVASGSTFETGESNTSNGSNVPQSPRAMRRHESTELDDINTASSDFSPSAATQEYSTQSPPTTKSYTYESFTEEDSTSPTRKSSLNTPTRKSSQQRETSPTRKSSQQQRENSPTRKSSQQRDFNNVNYMDGDVSLDTVPSTYESDTSVDPRLPSRLTRGSVSQSYESESASESNNQPVVPEKSTPVKTRLAVEKGDLVPFEMNSESFTSSMSTSAPSSEEVRTRFTNNPRTRNNDSSTFDESSSTSTSNLTPAKAVKPLHKPLLNSSLSSMESNNSSEFATIEEPEPLDKQRLERLRNKVNNRTFSGLDESSAFSPSSSPSHTYETVTAYSYEYVTDDGNNDNNNNNTTSTSFVSSPKPSKAKVINNNNNNENMKQLESISMDAVSTSDSESETIDEIIKNIPSRYTRNSYSTNTDSKTANSRFTQTQETTSDSESDKSIDGSSLIEEEGPARLFGTTKQKKQEKMFSETSEFESSTTDSRDNTTNQRVEQKRPQRVWRKEETTTTDTYTYNPTTTSTTTSSGTRTLLDAIGPIMTKTISTETGTATSVFDNEQPMKQPRFVENKAPKQLSDKDVVMMSSISEDVMSSSIESNDNNNVKQNYGGRLYGNVEDESSEHGNVSYSKTNTKPFSKRFSTTNNKNTSSEAIDSTTEDTATYDLSMEDRIPQPGMNNRFMSRQTTSSTTYSSKQQKQKLPPVKNITQVDSDISFTSTTTDSTANQKPIRNFAIRNTPTDETVSYTYQTVEESQETTESQSSEKVLPKRPASIQQKLPRIVTESFDDDELESTESASPNSYNSMEVESPVPKKTFAYQRPMNNDAKMLSEIDSMTSASTVDTSDYQPSPKKFTKRNNDTTTFESSTSTKSEEEQKVTKQKKNAVENEIKPVQRFTQSRNPSNYNNYSYDESTYTEESNPTDLPARFSGNQKQNQTQNQTSNRFVGKQISSFTTTDSSISSSTANLPQPRNNRFVGRNESFTTESADDNQPVYKQQQQKSQNLPPAQKSVQNIPSKSSTTSNQSDYSDEYESESNTQQDVVEQKTEKKKAKELRLPRVDARQIESLSTEMMSTTTTATTDERIPPKNRFAKREETTEYSKTVPSRVTDGKPVDSITDNFSDTFSSASSPSTSPTRRFTQRQTSDSTFTSTTVESTAEPQKQIREEVHEDVKPIQRFAQGRLYTGMSDISSFQTSTTSSTAQPQFNAKRFAQRPPTTTATTTSSIASAQPSSKQETASSYNISADVPLHKPPRMSSISSSTKETSTTSQPYSYSTSNASVNQQNYADNRPANVSQRQITSVGFDSFTTDEKTENYEQKPARFVARKDSSSTSVESAEQTNNNNRQPLYQPKPIYKNKEETDSFTYVTVSTEEGQENVKPQKSLPPPPRELKQREQQYYGEQIETAESFTSTSEDYSPRQQQQRFNKKYTGSMIDSDAIEPNSTASSTMSVADSIEPIPYRTKTSAAQRVPTDKPLTIKQQTAASTVTGKAIAQKPQRNNDQRLVSSLETSTTEEDSFANNRLYSQRRFAPQYTNTNIESTTMTDDFVQQQEKQQPQQIVANNKQEPEELKPIQRWQMSKQTSNDKSATTSSTTSSSSVPAVIKQPKALPQQKMLADSDIYESSTTETFEQKVPQKKFVAQNETDDFSETAETKTTQKQSLPPPPKSLNKPVKKQQVSTTYTYTTATTTSENQDQSTGNKSSMSAAEQRKLTPYQGVPLGTDALETNISTTTTETKAPNTLLAAFKQRAPDTTTDTLETTMTEDVKPVVVEEKPRPEPKPVRAALQLDSSSPIKVLPRKSDESSSYSTTSSEFVEKKSVAKIAPLPAAFAAPQRREKPVIKGAHIFVSENDSTTTEEFETKPLQKPPPEISRKPVQQRKQVQKKSKNLLDAIQGGKLMEGNEESQFSTISVESTDSNQVPQSPKAKTFVLPNPDEQQKKLLTQMPTEMSTTSSFSATPAIHRTRKFTQQKTIDTETLDTATLTDEQPKRRRPQNTGEKPKLTTRSREQQQKPRQELPKVPEEVKQVPQEESKKSTSEESKKSEVRTTRTRRQPGPTGLDSSEVVTPSSTSVGSTSFTNYFTGLTKNGLIRPSNRFKLQWNPDDDTNID